MEPDGGALPVEIKGVVACDCPAHARVILRDRANDRTLQVRVEAPAGQALLAELAGITSARSAAIDLFHDALEAAGARVAWVALRFQDNELRARMCVRRCAGGGEAIEAPADEALLLACRTSVALYVEGVAPRRNEESPAVPDVYRSAVESIDFSGLDG
jgi:bifunctional DNase/RNase